MKLKKILLILLVVLIVLFIIALIGSIKFPMTQSFRVVFGTFYILFLPGYIWSFVFFNKKSKGKKEDEELKKEDESIDGVERIILSFVLSLALSPMVLFFLNRIGMSINLLSSFLVILGIIIIGLGIIIYKEKFYKSKNSIKSNV